MSMSNLQVWIGDDFDLSKIEPIKNRTKYEGVWNKPFGGLWTSSYDLENPNFCEWGDFAFGKPISVYLLQIEITGEIYEIDSYEDFMILLNMYPLCLEHFPDKELNFEAIFKNYQAIHLTCKGQAETRLEFPYNLYGWDTESTLWPKIVLKGVEILK